MARNQTSKPGTPTPASGLYDVVGPRGGKTGRQVTSVEGHPLPPAEKPGETYRLAQRAKNDAGRGK